MRRLALFLVLCIMVTGCALVRGPVLQSTHGDPGHATVWLARYCWEVPQRRVVDCLDDNLIPTSRRRAEVPLVIIKR